MRPSRIVLAALVSTALFTACGDGDGESAAAPANEAGRSGSNAGGNGTSGKGGTGGATTAGSAGASTSAGAGGNAGLAGQAGNGSVAGSGGANGGGGKAGLAGASGSGLGGSGFGGAGPIGGASGSSGTGGTALDCTGKNAPPTAAKATSPKGNETVPGKKATLTVTVADADSDGFAATFFVREIKTLTAADDFSIVVMPDTQNYTQFPGNFPQYQEQTKWVADNLKKENIVALIHNGDVTQHGLTEDIEWQRADTAMKTIEKPFMGFPDGLPWGVSVGNHDNGAYGGADTEPKNTKLFNKYFGVARFEGRKYYGGHYGQDNDNSWFTARAGNLEIVVVNYEFRGAAGQQPAVSDWGTKIFDDHPDALGIGNTHFMINDDGNFSQQGKAIYESIKGSTNVQLLTGGHISDRARRKDEAKGRTVHSILCDFQAYDEPAPNKCAGGCGYFRIWQFSPMKDQMHVWTYSPSQNKTLGTPKDDFTISVDLSKAAIGPWEKVGDVKQASKTLTYEVTGLKANTRYEWYARIDDCGAKVSTEPVKFQTN